MTPLLERSRELHARARAWAHAFSKGDAPTESFDSFALDVVRYQAEAIAGIRRLMVAHAVQWTALKSVMDVPAVPTDAFKMTDLSAFAPTETPFVFRTSGTTVGARGVHRIRDIDTYDAGALAFGRLYLMREGPPRVPVLVLGPPPREVPDSSLTHMIALFAREFGEVASTEETYFLRDGELDVDGLVSRVARLRGAPVLLLGTSFAFVHLIDSLGARQLALGAGSRLMQTGGYKGRTREVPADELRAALGSLLGIDERAILSEYGMTELSSQFYEASLWDGLPHGVYKEPPWARVVPVAPDTLQPVPDGEMGIGRIIDLLNIDSPSVIQTQDRVRRVPGGFELHGRHKGATPRGCSISIDELLSK